MAKRREVNIFRKSQQIKEKGRVSDMDYLDNFEQLDTNTPKEEVKPVEEPTPVAKAEVQEIAEKPKRGRKKKKNNEWVRTTFIIEPNALELLRDVVHTVKSTGNYQYSQKQALTEAMQLLGKKVKKEVGEIRKAPEE